MPSHKAANVVSLIPITSFDICLVDNLTRVEISKRYTRQMLNRRSTFYLDKFIHHLKTVHQLDIRTYCKTYLKIDWPKCPTTGRDGGYRIGGTGLSLTRFSKGGVSREHCPAFDESCKRMSKTRKGNGNPMHGKAAWNRGITPEMDERVARSIAHAQKTAYTPEVIEKRRQKAVGRPSKTKGKRIHTDERREWFKGHTARLWQRGVFNKVSSIHVKMREFLSTLPTKQSFVEEHAIGPFSVDFAFPDAKIAIEADGDYYHVNPEFYPNGPENAMQRRNHGRDYAKNRYLETCGWQIWRYWEHHINDGSFKDPLICKLKQSALLDA